MKYINEMDMRTLFFTLVTSAKADDLEDLKDLEQDFSGSPRWWHVDVLSRVTQWPRITFRPQLLRVPARYLDEYGPRKYAGSTIVLSAPRQGPEESTLRLRSAAGIKLKNQFFFLSMFYFKWYYQFEVLLKEYWR